MLRKYALFVGVAALGALVTSCGGGDSGDPTPTPTPTETPTPTPTTSVDFDLMGDFEAQSSNGNYTFAFFTPNGGGDEVFSAGSRRNGSASIALTSSPDTASFGFPDLEDLVTFAAGDLVSGTATRREYARTNEGLVLELPFGESLRVSYETSQAFTRDTTVGTLRGDRVALFFNPVTTSDDITADLTYTGAVDVVGGDPGVTQSGVISAANASFTVSEADNSISGTIEIYEDVNGTDELVATLVFAKETNSSGTATGGVVSSTGAFQGNLTDTANNLVGNYAGALAGPNREEMVLLFSISGDTDVDADDDRRYVGSFIGAD